MPALAAITALLFVYALLATVLDRWSITAPIVLVLGGVVVGQVGLANSHFGIDAEVATTAVELTLALLLFTDAATVPLAAAEDDARYDGRLLAVGLPLTIILGAIVGVLLFPTMGLAVAAVLAVILAPTDAALGLPLVSNARIPTRVRRILLVESGLNDGIATPFLVLFLAIATEGTSSDHWLAESALEIGIAVATAAVVGGAGGWLLARARASGLAGATPTELAVVALAILAYAVAVTLGGNGFVAAFSAGIAFRAVTGGRLHEADGFAESLGLFASFLVWTLFGAVLVGPVLTRGFDVPAIAYAALSLTVVRMVPVALALAGSGFRPDTVGLIGWFGPRGLASVVFTFLAIGTLGPGGHPTDELLAVATWTVFLSILLHGLSAGPVARWYGSRITAAAATIPENRDVQEPAQRRLGLP